MSPRATSKEHLRDELIRLTGDTSQSGTIHVQPIRQAVQSAIRLAAEKAASKAAGSSSMEAVVVVCGTAFMMSEVRATLGVVEPRDADLFEDDTAMRDAQVRLPTNPFSCFYFLRITY